MSSLNYFIFSFFVQIILINSYSIIDYSHRSGDLIDIEAGSLSSKRAIVPYGYTKLNICKTKKIIKAEDTLGEILTGEAYYTTGYIAKINEDKFCEILCYNSFAEKDIKLIKQLIKRRYFSNWVVDKLPAGMILFNKETKQTSLKYFNGIPLGFTLEDKFYLYNHLQFHILLNKIDEDKFNIVGFNILPMSIKHNADKPLCEKQAKDILKNLDLPLQPLEEGKILFTYDIVYEYSDITFASRWDHYKVSKSSIHWTGIIISQILVCFITGFVIYIFKKNISTDIDSYNYKVSQYEELD